MKLFFILLYVYNATVINIWKRLIPKIMIRQRTPKGVSKAGPPYHTARRIKIYPLFSKDLSCSTTFLIPFVKDNLVVVLQTVVYVLACSSVKANLIVDEITLKGGFCPIIIELVFFEPIC